MHRVNHFGGEGVIYCSNKHHHVFYITFTSTSFHTILCHLPLTVFDELNVTTTMRFTYITNTCKYTYITNDKIKQLYQCTENFKF